MAALRATEIFNDPGFRLIVIESVELYPGKTSAVYHCSGRLEPVAVIICSTDDRYAVDMQGGLADIEAFKRNVPELNAMLTSFNDAM